MKRMGKGERVGLPIFAAIVIWAMAFVGCGKEETINNAYYYNYSTFYNTSTIFTNATTTIFTNITTFTNNTTTTVPDNSIVVASPNGGETLSRGGNMSASWTLTADQNYSLFFYLIPQGTITISGPTYYDPSVGGYSMGVYSPTAIETSGSWAINIPSDIDMSAPYKLKIYLNKRGNGIFSLLDVLASDDSGAGFTIQ